MKGIAERHYAVQAGQSPSTPTGWCWSDGHVWPCDAALLLDELDTLERRGRAADARLTKIIAAYEKTMLDHDVSYEDFAEVVRLVRYALWVEERDARAALSEARSLISRSSDQG